MWFQPGGDIKVNAYVEDQSRNDHPNYKKVVVVLSEFPQIEQSRDHQLSEKRDSFPKSPLEPGQPLQTKPKDTEWHTQQSVASVSAFGLCDQQRHYPLPQSLTPPNQTRRNNKKSPTKTLTPYH